MTFIQPNRIQDRIANLILGLSVVLIFVFGIGVYLYSQIVTLRHDTQVLRAGLEATTVKNAEIKNELYGIIDPSNLEKIAKNRGLVKDKNPQWAFASQY